MQQHCIVLLPSFIEPRPSIWHTILWRHHLVWRKKEARSACWCWWKHWETREKNHWWEVATMASSSISSTTRWRDLMLLLLFSPFSLLCFSLLLQLLFRYLIMRLLFCFSSFVTSRQRRGCYFLSCLSKGIFCLTRCISTLLILTPLTPQALIGFICKSWFLVGHSITIVFHPSCAFSRSPAACRIVGQQEQSANVLIESIIL